MIACLARVYYMVEEEYNATQDKKSVNIKNGIVYYTTYQHTMPIIQAGQSGSRS